MADKPRMGDIRPVKKPAPLAGPSFSEPVLKVRQDPQLVEIPKTYHEYIRTPKSIQRRSKLRKYIIIWLFILAALYTGIYFLSSITTTIVPKEEIRTINQSVTLDSWTSPLKTTVMSVSEKMNISNKEEIEDAKVQLEKKIKSRLRYDMPEGYLLMESCSSTITYTEPTETDTFIEAKVSTLIFEKKSLEKYLLKITAGDEFYITDISKLSCSLRVGIESPDIISRSVSFILNGDITLLPIIDTDAIALASKGKTYANYNQLLRDNSRIGSYTIHTAPAPIFPILPKNSKRIHVILNQ